MIPVPAGKTRTCRIPHAQGRGQILHLVPCSRGRRLGWPKKQPEFQPTWTVLAAKEMFPAARCKPCSTCTSCWIRPFLSKSCNYRRKELSSFTRHWVSFAITLDFIALLHITGSLTGPATLHPYAFLIELFCYCFLIGLFPFARCNWVLLASSFCNRSQVAPPRFLFVNLMAELVYKEQQKKYFMKCYFTAATMATQQTFPLSSSSLEAQQPLPFKTSTLDFSTVGVLVGS